MSGKKLINAPSSAVDECLEGLVATHPGLTLLQDHRVVVRSDLPTDTVTLISGGGAGHEPAHAGNSPLFAGKVGQNVTEFSSLPEAIQS
jgi:dihydroxyacetone kinase